MTHDGRLGVVNHSSRRKMMSHAVLSVVSVLAATPGRAPASASVTMGMATGTATGAAKTGIEANVLSSGATAVGEGQSGFISGIAVSLVKQSVLYPVDTVKVRLQTVPIAPGEKLWTRAGLFKDLYRGFLVPLLFNAPAGGVFFAGKDFVKSSLGNLGNIPSTLIAIFVASFPYWIVRQPSEILKVRRQTGKGANGGIIESLRDAAQQLDVRTPGTLKDLFQGFGSNLAYTFPADAIKFVVYDYIKVRLHRLPRFRETCLSPQRTCTHIHTRINTHIHTLAHITLYLSQPVHTYNACARPQLRYFGPC
jgi:solute carrier family 25 S-adenosylmethionine transporter 26